MDRSDIERFSIESRRKLIASVESAMVELGVGPDSRVESIESAGGVTIITLEGGLQTSISTDEAKWREQLVQVIDRNGYENVVEQVAYTWFNRLIAVRYMEVNDYLPTHVRVLSSLIPGKDEPDLITRFMNLDLGMTDPEKAAAERLRDADDSDALFSMLFMIQCRKLNDILPELFTFTKPYENLLLRLSYINPDGVVRDLVDSIPEDNFRDAVQIIGWMYQYYNTEQNNLVYDGSLSKSKLPKELVPAATTIYTPDWVVKYMVDNSLGRMWFEEGFCDIPHESTHYLKHIDRLSKLRSDRGPDDFKIIDPCMGSGHILVYAFDLLMEMYRSSGYSDSDAAEMIIQNNLFGADVNERAYQLAYFALMMKARHYDSRFLEKEIVPNLTAIIETGDIDEQFLTDVKNNLDLDDAMILSDICERFTDSREYGSLLEGVETEGLVDALRTVKPRITMDYNHRDEISILKRLIRCSDILSGKYDVVVTNPPYLGSSRFSEKLSNYAKSKHPVSKSDLSMMMYESSLKNISKENGYVAYITTNSWMFLSSFEKLRSIILDDYHLVDVLDLGSELFEGKVGHNLIVSWITKNQKSDLPFTATKLDTFCYSQRDRKEPEFFNPDNEYVMEGSSLRNIPGAPIAYWLTSSAVSNFTSYPHLSDYVDARIGMVTGNNDRFLRRWFEVDLSKIQRNAIAKHSNSGKWFPLQKGGDARFWYGNFEYVVNWENDGFEIKYDNKLGSRIRSHNYNNEQQFKAGITWNSISSSIFSCRYVPQGFTFDAAGPLCEVLDEKKIFYILGLLTSQVSSYYFNILNPTINFTPGYLGLIPCIIGDEFDSITEEVCRCVEYAKMDWDKSELSMDFEYNPLIHTNEKNMEAACCTALELEKSLIQHIRELSYHIDEYFIQEYKLADNLTPAPRDIGFIESTSSMLIKNYISYFVGCMFGRFSLNTPGLIIAADGYDCSEYSIFIPDNDNVVPINDNEYFGDDIVSRFVEFVCITFGDENLEENLKFIANNLGIKGAGTARERIRKYFLNDFYKDHLKMYSNLPIYWLFDSGKENGFKALIYMHRYNEDLIAKMRQDYLLPMQRRYMEQFESEKDATVRSKLEKKINEISTYDLAMELYSTEKVSIDLDDGVKVNYARFQNIDNPGGKGKINLLHKLK